MKSLLLFGLLGAVMTSAQGPRPQPCPTTDYSCKCERLMGLNPPPPRGSPPPPGGGGGGRPPPPPPPGGGGARPPPGGGGGGSRPPPPPPPGSPKDQGLRETIKKQCFNGTEPTSGQEPVLTDAQKNCIFNVSMTSKGVIVGGVINTDNAIKFMTSSVEEQALALGLSPTAVTAVKAQLSEAVQTCFTTYSAKEQIPDFRSCVKDKCQAALAAQA